MPWREDRGSSVVEFVLMSTLLLVLLFGVMQVGLYMYARNVTAAAAADGARYAAPAQVSAAEGARRAQDVLRSALHGAAAAITCTARLDVDVATRLQTTSVRCAGRVRSVFAPLGGWLGIDVSGSALREPMP